MRVSFSSSLYYYKDLEGKLIGPLSEIGILDLRDAGHLLDETQVCQAETETWSSLVELNLQRPQLPATTYLTDLIWRTLPSLCIIGLIGIIGLVVFIYHISHDKVSPPTGNNSTASTQPSAPHPVVLTRTEIQQLRAAQEVALHANPDLVTEYRGISMTSRPKNSGSMWPCLRLIST